ncbi:ATP phosphoribosyltransferase regulatory subunit [Desmospora profundinema]|uniref:ATP phosphoribosyltransferase regulatory subunit n=1 Tax=Desmospora profundinema TaxID=1571184 RepID=A0ABU1ILH2_9BACL|nr:ATP phosphoribosyltransferase regulatory subunit [Desmospora profundinema]MDR6225630.1 ATP phosphoribosyltransferase regulatory subunit [Desmospora profundinema]
MGKPREFEKPMGVRDFLPEMACKKQWVERQVEERFSAWGYQEVITPTLEFYDTVGGASAIDEDKLFKLLDGQGKTLVLRPDQTAPIARVVASLMREVSLPIRLFYHANVFRAQEREAGRSAEFFQSGVELVGDDSPEADAEVLALAVESLQACDVGSIQLAIGHIGLLDALLMEQLNDRQTAEELRECLGRRNLVEYSTRVASLELSEERKARLLSVLNRRGDDRVLHLWKETESPRVREMIAHLEAVWEALRDWGMDRFMVLDLSLVGSLDYYTGLYFEGYGAASYYLLSGGRYDRLLNRFDRPAPARGFALKTDRLIMASRGTGTKKERITLTYDRTNRKQAFQEAERLRKQGKAVTLRLVEGSSPVAIHSDAGEDSGRVETCAAMQEEVGENG